MAFVRSTAVGLLPLRKSSRPLIYLTISSLRSVPRQNELLDDQRIASAYHPFCALIRQPMPVLLQSQLLVHLVKT